MVNCNGENYLFSSPTAGWADETERQKYHSGQDALQMSEVIARLRNDLALRRGAPADEETISALELPEVLIQTYLLQRQYPKRDAVLAQPTGGSCSPR